MGFQQLTGVNTCFELLLTSDRCHLILCTHHLLPSRLSLSPRQFPRLRHLRNNKFPLHHPSATLRRQSRSSRTPPHRGSHHFHRSPDTRLPLRPSRCPPSQRLQGPCLWCPEIHCHNKHLHYRRCLCLDLGRRRK